MSELRSFVSEGTTEVKGRGTIYGTRADRDGPRDNFIPLGEHVLIDGREMVVHGVERFLPMRPIRAGEPIGILAEPVS